jgi:hypothetical protein
MAGDALSFHVTNANLNAAIEILRALDGLERYPEAYQILVLERSRRELQSPPNEIRLYGLWTGELIRRGLYRPK